ncbi:MAG: outer membrane lipoprotein LolB [Betaproteobacteria bacterium]|nr:outer membrane lipoprotein LolB [Betaproteobacteria bacterium]
MKLCAVCKSGISALWAALLLSGCAAVTAVTAVQEPAGIKMSAAAEVHADGMPSRRARLTWARIGGRDIVEIKTPLGTTQAKIVIDDGGAKIHTGGREMLPEEAGGEVARWLKLLPPPHSIGYWLLGKSDPGYSAHEIFVPGKQGISRIIQHGWEIVYAGRGEDGRPARIEFRADAPDSAGAAKNARAEVKISKWFPIP